MPHATAANRPSDDPARHLGGFMALTRIEQPWALIACAAALGCCVPLRMVIMQTEFLHLLPRLAPPRAGWNRAT